MQLVTGSPAGISPADVTAAGGTLTYAGMMTPAGLAEVARYADILAPDTRSIIPLLPDGRLGTPAPVVADAHRAGLVVMPWTFRPENQFLAADFRGAGGATAHRLGRGDPGVSGDRHRRLLHGRSRARQGRRGRMNGRRSGSGDGAGPGTMDRPSRFGYAPCVGDRGNGRPLGVET